MARICQVADACSPSAQANSYVYAILPTAGNGLAAITSSDEAIVLDRSRLSNPSRLSFPDVPRNVSCLVSGNETGDVVLCSGGDGTVASFDLRTQNRVGYFKTDRGVTALACRNYSVALGTEYARQQAIVSVWDQRQNRQIWQNGENSDDITAIDFHPSVDNLLLAGGDDGQVSIFDTNVVEEDDSMIQGVNHGPIHKAGFLSSERFFALSSDQNLSIYPVAKPDDVEDPQPTLLGDLRAVIPCEYVIDVFRSGDGWAVAAGSNNEAQRVDILELRYATNSAKSPKLKPKTRYVLQSAHGEEVVRSVFADGQTGSVFTAGEDGQVKAFVATSIRDDASPNATSTKVKQAKQGSEGRYKPY